MRSASLFVRILAFIIDTLVLVLFTCCMFAATLAGYALSPGPFSPPRVSVLVLLFILGSWTIHTFYFTYLTMNGNTTMGKHFFRVKVVRSDGTGLTGYRAFLRTIAYPLSLFFCLATLLVALFFNKRMLHDIIAGSQVIEEES